MREPSPTEDSVELTEASAAALVPERAADGHKGTHGRVTVLAGSFDYAGAALMTGTAALRTGAGLVTLFLPESLRPHLLGRVPELILLGLKEGSDGTIDARAAFHEVAGQASDALLVGPGLASDHPTASLVTRLLGAAGAPAVVDASAFDMLRSAPGWWERLKRDVVLTPHPGEMARLGIEPGTDGDARRAAAATAAVRWGQVVVLKGARTVIAAPDGELAEAAFELPALGTAGTGDILAGVIASLLGQGLAPFDAARLGVYLHGRAGTHISERLGDAGLMATDLLFEIPRVRRHLGSMRDRAMNERVGFGDPGARASED